jgi:hypothetical protein
MIEDEEILRSFTETCITGASVLGPHPSGFAMMEAIEALRSFFDLVTNIESSQYRNFNTEWNRIIWGIIAVFRLVQSALTFDIYDRGVTDQLAKFGHYFEILCFRSKDLSASGKDAGPPDIFLMFDSVLCVVREKYASLVDKLSDRTESSSPSSKASSSLFSLCPVMNGNIKNTDYWDAYSSTVMQSTFTAEDAAKFPQMGNWMLWDPVNNEQMTQENVDMETVGFW